MVYNGNLSDLNVDLWDPSFSFPTVKSTLRVVGRGPYMDDQDIKKIFLNFMLSEEVRPYCGLILIRLLQRRYGKNASRN